MLRKISTLLMLMLVPAYMFAQTGEIHGRMSDAQTRGPLIGATVTLVGTRMGALTDANGDYSIKNVPTRQYTLRAAYVGYITIERTVTVGADPMTLDLALDPTVIESGEVLVERNRARERETPVAFTNVGKMEIEQKIHGQDAPMLIKGTPGVFTYSPDGVGNGETKLMVRGFSQEYVQVLINGIPTNDPESNAVYWSNWGSVSSSAATIQVQRGAGSSLYGAGAFGGSFNIVTSEAPAKPSYGFNLSVGSPLNSMYGLELNTGLVNNSFSGTLRVDRKVAEGSRISGRYEGLNYYGSLSWYINPQQSLKFVLHGAPQKHGYSNSANISYFKKYGYTANPAFILPRAVVGALPSNPNDGQLNYGLLDNVRELVDDRYVNLAHNFYHKTQAELHYQYDLTPTSALQVNAFYSKGRGGGSSVVGTNFPYKLNSDGTITASLGPDGTIVDPLVARNVYLANAFQKISYSFHQQGGVLANFESRPLDFLRLSLGGELRMWTADHPGYFTNLYGKTSIVQPYSRRDVSGKTLSTPFYRKLYQGDLDGPGDVGNIFAWNTGTTDPTYKNQYRNYHGETPQMTIFAEGNWQYDRLNLLTSIQYVWYKYKLTEALPSEKAIGQQLTPAQVVARSITQEGPTGAGTFMMRDTSAAGTWYEFPLVNATRSRGFLQPKAGLNYNLTDNINLFGNYAHVERFVNLGVYYNQGLINPNAQDEKSDQFEVGAGWSSEDLRVKINGYTMTWANKSAVLKDISQAGINGYDRDGNRYELVGKSQHKGIELEANVKLDRWLPVKGFELQGSFTYMENKWKEVLPSVTVDNTGARRVFATATDANGKTYSLYFDQLANTPVASGPQTMMMLALNYSDDRYFAGASVDYFARQYVYDGGYYLATNGYFAFNSTGKRVFVSTFDNTLPKTAILNVDFGVRFNVFGLNTTASVQVLNLFDKDYLVNADNNGVIPGEGQALRFNLYTGF